MSTIINFIKNLLSTKDESYIGLSSFAEAEDEAIFKKAQPRKRNYEPTLSELLRKD